MEETPAEEADRVSKLTQITRWVCETPTPLASKASIQQTMANTTLASSDSTLPNFPDLQRTRGLVKDEEQLEHFSSKDTITQTSSDPALPDLPSMPTSLVRNNYRDRYVREEVRSLPRTGGQEPQFRTFAFMVHRR